MTTTALLSELEAVNIVLAAAEQAPVNSLSIQGMLPLSRARAALDEVSRSVQEVGWKFNTDYAVELYPDATTKEITLAGDVLKLDADDCYSTDPVQRGARLYDSKGRTYQFSAPIKATIITLLPWDELPQCIRQLIAIRAARLNQRRTFGSETLDAFTQDEEAAAVLACAQYECQVGDHNVLRDNWDTAQVLYGRYF